MKSALLRTSSVPALSPAAAASPSFSNYRLSQGVFTGLKNSVSTPKISLHFEINKHRRRNSSGIRRASSESDISRSLRDVWNPYEHYNGGAGSRSQSRSRSRSFPSGIPEEEFLEESEGFDSGIDTGDVDDSVSDTFPDRISERIKIRSYYEDLLKMNPNDALLLRNYGKFLHEVEKDAMRSEECYSRAILANPSDGELLALFGKFIWESQRDKQRAEYYFERAVHASPNDCLVVGYYTYFLWQIEEDDNEEVAAEISPAAMVAAF